MRPFVLALLGTALMGCSSLERGSRLSASADAHRKYPLPLGWFEDHVATHGLIALRIVDPVTAGLWDLPDPWGRGRGPAPESEPCERDSP
jgi:hypothetical protein